jgi:hypothetical protein
MKLPSLMIVNSAICQIILGRTLGLSLGLLNLSMICPYTTKSRKAETSAEAQQEHSET